MPVDFDFIGFTYNGKHSYNDFGFYRTSDGSRYNDNLVPQMTDKTADVPGGDGQYYFYTKHKARQFSIPIAFDHLEEETYREMRNWLDGKGIYDLIFDEAPYKVYSAKVTGTPQLKTICFEEDVFTKDKEGNITKTGVKRIYKGEGTIQFTCYYPYAHTPRVDTKIGYNKDTETYITFDKDGRVLNSYSNSNKELWSIASEINNSFTNGDNYGDLPAPFKVKIDGTAIAGTVLQVGTLKITLPNETQNLEWDSKTGLVTATVEGAENTPILYTGTSYGTLPVGTYNDNIIKLQYKEKTTDIIYKTASLEYDYWYY